MSATAGARAVFVVAAKRTPFGAWGGALKGLSATDLSVIASRSALSEGKVNPEIVDSVIIGNVIQVRCVCVCVRACVCACVCVCVCVCLALL